MHAYAWLWPQSFCHIQACSRWRQDKCTTGTFQVCTGHFKTSAACSLACKEVAVLCCAARNLALT